MFKPITLRHKEHIDWAQVTHIRVKSSAKADTPAGERILEHLRSKASIGGIVEISAVENGFPTVRNGKSHLTEMRTDLRHMANLRESGVAPENKGLIELGSLVGPEQENLFPEQAGSKEVHKEGAVQRITVNRYERDRKAREKCLEAWGVSCVVCGFNFSIHYGGRGEGFIHVHHLNPVSSAGEEYVLDPVADLRPVCPNCHAMIHRFDPPMSIEELKKLVADCEWSA